jgi:hypothetical protein
MEKLDEIIAVAKTKEKWSASGKYNYGPIDYLEENILNQSCIDEKGLFSLKKYKALFDEYEKNVHRVTDWKTFLTYEYIKFDITVDVTELICTMARTFPETRNNQRKVLLHIGKLCAEDKMKNPVLNHAVLNESVRNLGMSTLQLLGLTLV